MKKIRKLCGRSYCKDSCKDANNRKKETEERDPINSEPRKCCNAACRCRNIGSGCPSAAKKVRDLERSCRRRKKRRKRRSNIKKACFIQNAGIVKCRNFAEAMPAHAVWLNTQSFENA